MRVSRQKAAENREHIIDAASRLFREQGFDAVGIDTIMRGAGLTHGGFYGHFASKDELAAQALSRAMERSDERQDRFETLGDLVSDYLSVRHRDACGQGCAIAALGADVARQGGSLRHVLTVHVRTALDRLVRLVKSGSAASRRKRAIATLAGLVGALVIARAVDDAKLSDEIVAAARELYGREQP